MGTKEDGDAPEEWQVSPYQVFQQISEGAVRVAGEALHNVYSRSSNIELSGSGQTQSQSEVMTHRRSNSFQRWKSQMQKALRWGTNSREQSRFSCFNPEVLASQKRQWYQRHSKTSVSRLDFSRN